MSDASPTGRGPLARELLRLRCLQLDTAPLREIIAYDRAATAAAEAWLHARAAEIGEPAVRPAALPPPGLRQPPARLLLTWYLSGRSAFCRAALTALAAEFARSDGRTEVVALTPEPPVIARRTRVELALPFPVVHDDGRAADDFGIRYEAPAEFARFHELPTGDLEPASAEASLRPAEVLSPGQSVEPFGVPLPLAAMFLIDAGRISRRFVHPDSRYRAEPAEFLRACASEPETRPS